MSADARPLTASAPAAVAYRPPHSQEGYRLFPTRLSFERPSRRSGDPALATSTTRFWLLTRLRILHAGLERRIAEEAARPRPDTAAIGALKRERLAVRDRMAGMERGA